jgi:hypothetical protein
MITNWLGVTIRLKELRQWSKTSKQYDKCDFDLVQFEKIIHYLINCCKCLTQLKFGEFSVTDEDIMKYDVVVCIHALRHRQR